MEKLQIPQPTFYIFKCEQGSPLGIPKPSCIDDESRDLYNYMSQSLMAKGIMGYVQSVKTNCLGRCQMGPVMMIEPGHYMYVQLNKEKIDKIIDEHLIGGNPIQEYIIEDQYWGNPQSINK